MSAASPVHPQIRLQFDDNALLPILFGDHDRHLARIEQKLEVTLASRGNQVQISGTPGAATAAQTVLQALYKRLVQDKGKRRGEMPDTLDAATVDAEIRFAVDRDRTSSAGEAASVAIATWKRPIEPRSPTQFTYVQALRQFELVFGLGPAGTGKTYLAVAFAVAMVKERRVDRIILSRPAVEAGERLGFLPGDMKEKVDPYMRPLYDALYDTMPGDQVQRRMDSGEIEVAPLAFMRGRTLANAFVILDEAQNTTPTQMKMFLTRMGENSRMTVTGDLSQVDLPHGQRSGLRDAVDTLKGMQGVSFVNFTDADVVRHPLVTRIVRAYDAVERPLVARAEAGDRR